MLSVGQSLGIDFSTYEPPTPVSDEIIAVVDLFDEIVLFEVRKAARDRGPVVVQIDRDYGWRENLQFFRLCQDVQDPILALGHPLGTLPNRHSTPVVSFGVFLFTGNRYGTVFSDHDIVVRFKCTRGYVATTRGQFADPSLMGPFEKRTPLQSQRARVRSRENGTRPMYHSDPAADKGRDTTAGQHTIDWDAVRSEVGE